jgi:hypothetical protein
VEDHELYDGGSMRKKIKLSEGREKHYRSRIWGSSALIAVSVILLQDFITIGITDVPGFISVVALSLSIPILSGAIVAARSEINDQYYMGGKLANFPNISFWAGAIIATFGVAAAFWHLLWIVGVLFIVAVLVICVLMRGYWPTAEERKMYYEEQHEKEVGGEKVAEP